MFESNQFLEANKYLIRFYYVYKYKSLTKAAQNFYSAGSDRNMKYAVTQLEEIYGVKLANITTSKVEFTAFGDMVAHEAEKIYNINSQINSMIRRIQMKEIRFATSYDFFKYYIAPVFKNFQRKFVDVNITIVKTNQKDAIERLKQREVDFVVGTLPMEQDKDIVYEPFTKAKMLLVYLPNSRHKFDEITTLKEIAGYKGAINDVSAPFYENFEATLRSLDLTMNIVYQITDYESLIQLVREGLVDYAIAGNYSKEESLLTKDISDLFYPINICFIYRKGEEPSNTIRELIDVSRVLKVKPI